MKVINWIKNNKVTTGIIIWLILGIVAFIVHWTTYNGISWGVLTGFATWVLSGGVFFAFFQIREARKSTNAQIAVELFEILRNKESMDTLRFIYELNPEDPAIIYINDKHRIEYLLDRLNLLAGLVRNNIVDKELAINTYAGVATLRCWYILHNYIYDSRKEQNRNALHYSFEGYAHLCMEKFAKRGINVGFESSKYTDCNTNNLVSKLQDAKEEKDENRKKLYPRTWDEIEKDLRKTSEE